jgi:hypothetical protein
MNGCIRHIGKKIRGAEFLCSVDEQLQCQFNIWGSGRCLHFCNDTKPYCIDYHGARLTAPTVCDDCMEIIPYGQTTSKPHRCKIEEKKYA